MTGLKLHECDLKMAVDIVGTLIAHEARETYILPSVSLAQAILETGWFKSGLCTNANALFGIKAGNNWNGKVCDVKTKEVYDGTWYTVNACFRAYDSIGESIKDHSNFLRDNIRYSKIIGEKDYKIVANELYKAGYATDPEYANKLISIIEKNNLVRYDYITEYWR